MKYFRFILRHFKFVSTTIFLLKNVESLIHIYILISVNELVELLNRGIHIDSDRLWYIIFASALLVGMAIVSLQIHLYALKRAQRILSIEITGSEKRLAGENHSIKARAITHIIDTISEPGNWLSLPSRLIIITTILYSFNFNLIWPLISASVVMLFSFALSKYQYRLAKDTVRIIKSRSYMVRRLVKRQHLRTKWMKEGVKSAFEKEMHIRNKGTFIEELSQQAPVATSLLFAIFVTHTSIVPNNQVMVFVFSTMLISSIISEFPAIIGMANKTSEYFSLVVQEDDIMCRDRLWSGSLASNTLMHECADICHDIFESIFGERFLNKHKINVNLNELSTAQQNVILAVRDAWAQKTSVIPEKYQYSMDVDTRNILSSKLKHLFKDA